MTAFILGLDGAIGSALYERLRRDGKAVAGSTRRPSVKSNGVVYLDLSASEQFDLPAARSAVICAGVSTIAACRSSPASTRAINVNASLEVAKRFAERGTFVIGLSTNLVFDGRKPLRPATDVPTPGTEYGRQKRDLEQGILSLGNRGAIVRLTKVVSSQTALLRTWRDSLLKGEEIFPYTDMAISPVPLGRVVDALGILTVRCLSGVYQLSAAHDVSYVEAAHLLADLVNAPSSLVRPRPPPEDILPAERPAFTSLDTTRAGDDLGWRAIEPASTLREIFRTQT